MFSGEFREDVIEAEQTVRCQVTDCFFSKFAKDDLQEIAEDSEEAQEAWRSRGAEALELSLIHI